ncbi:MAG: isoprenylcysteine carboxylmethyltransferase family protein [Alphaproteobacteria bacterium]|nr:isoprenylcysteine carboxylmethyltransferase family protein [Alphaproteobacteria bacterium]
MRRRLSALALGALCHGTFVVAVAAMAFGLFTGLTRGAGPARGLWAWALDLALLSQMPLLHSLLLTPNGRRALRRLAGQRDGTLDTTLYATAASAQVLATFALWAPLGEQVWIAEGTAWAALTAGFAAGWLLLGLAMAEAGLGVQTGLTGWWARLREQPPRYPSFPTRGLHGLVRHPIYAAFMLILWTGPTWTLDRVLLGGAWSAYCVLGPRLKERRYAQRHGARYLVWAARTPWFSPARETEVTPVPEPTPRGA